MNKFKRFIRYYRPYRATFLLVLIATMVNTITSLAIPMLIRSLTQSFEGKINEGILQTLIVIIVLIAVFLLSLFFMSYKGHMIGASIENDMRQDLFEHMQNLSHSFFNNQKVGALLSRLTSDLYNLGELAHHAPENVIHAGFGFIGSIFLMYQINTTLTFVLLGIIPIVFVFLMWAQLKMERAYESLKENNSMMNATAEESLSGHHIVKAFANEDYEVHKFKEHGKDFLKHKREFYTVEVLFYDGIEGFIMILPLIIICVGSFILHLPMSDIFAFILLISSFTNPIKQIMYSVVMFQDGITGFKRFLAIMDTPTDIVEIEDPIVLTNPKGLIVFDNVSFRYNESLPWVLNDLNITINPNEFVAIVGESGAGKTTISALLPRFYDIEKGAITIDGINIRDMQLQSLRRNIGIVQQDVYLFSGTIHENIQYGLGSAKKEDIIVAAKKANAHDFIMKLPNGYDTEVGHRGVKLSGGQRQRISIARVFLNDPKILIFDEATSALDNESERIVQEAMETLSTGRTCIVIAHRLSSIENANRILYLKKGHITESGTHEELIALDGDYASLYKKK